MSPISKADFLAHDDAAYEEVEVPHWGIVRVRSLSGAGRDQYLRHAFDKTAEGSLVPKTEDAEARLLALTLVDEEGKPWFQDVEEGVRVLREKNAGSLQKAYFAALKLNSLAEGDLEEAAANLDETPNVEPGSS
jgi:hypothetical protein